jgi:hypothetical protein
MREDLAKCTTERPRSGGSWAACYKLKFGGKVRVSTDPEDSYDDEFGGFKSSARRRHFEYKQFTDRLGALRGNIRKAVGRPWNDVFSEFSRILDRRSVSGHHIWSHMMWEVEPRTFMVGSEVWCRTMDGNECPVSGFYVHPLTGILEEAPDRYTKAIGRARWAKKKELEFPVPDEVGWHYKQFEGLWFRYRVVERKTPIGTQYDVLKRQANKKELVWIRAQVSAAVS